MPDEQRVGDVVHEAGVAARGRLRAGKRCQRGDSGGGGKKLPALRIGHLVLPMFFFATAMLSSMFGQMMPAALERLKDEAPKAARKTNGA